jgi:sugar lactone lactonase YvrE
MTHGPRTGAALTVAVLIATAGAARAQSDIKPTNDLSNPYRTVEGWAKLPGTRTWGSTSAVDIDKDGLSIWVAERCEANSCLNSNLDPIMKFDSTGKLVKSFGAGMLIFPHGIHVDRDGNIWVTDGQDNRPRQAAGAPPVPEPDKLIGHQVFKFSPDGELLLTLGKLGGGREPEYFWQPNDVLTLSNGDILVAEGHSSSPTAHARILRFDRTGKFIEVWGKRGSGPGEFDQPHGLAMDSQGRIFVADRSNNRLQILDQTGKHIASWYQFSRPSGVYIDSNDVLYVADSESGSVSRDANRQLTRTDWKRGIRIGSARDGSLTAFIPDPTENPPSTSSAEGVAVDARGNVYGAEVGQKALKRYVKNGKD